MMKVKVLRLQDYIHIVKMVNNQFGIWQSIVMINPEATYVGGLNGIKTIDKFEDAEIVQLMLGTCQGYYYEFIPD